MMTLLVLSEKLKFILRSLHNQSRILGFQCALQSIVSMKVTHQSSPAPEHPTSITHTDTH